ncbi:Crp/Fnr family transcriptional regulator [Bernardetia sp. Wsw4-3y2]|uniref:Crp/Fnr family transcriptional regulator n=1 Tax=Bernardetia sp. Wsw4-3y2 TaxID=3127471 RepID=UPI0030D611E8
MLEELRNHINAITPLTYEEFSFVCSLFVEKKIKKKQFLIKEGDSVKYAYFIVSGLLKLTYVDDLGKVHIVSFGMEDWWESDFQAYFTQSKARMSLQAIEDTSVLCLSLKNYQKMCLEVPKMKTFLIEMSNKGFIASQQRILSLLTTSVKERYEKLLQKYPLLFQRVPKAQLALYLGCSRETLSRISS